MTNISVQRVSRALIVVVCALVFWADLRLPGLEVSVFAESQGRNDPAGPCQADDKLRAYHNRFVEFEVPANWKVLDKGDEILAGPPDGACGLSVILRTDPNMGRFSYDPGTADRIFLAANPKVELIGRAFDLAIGNEVPGKRMTLKFNTAGVIGRMEALVAVGANQTFSAAFLVMNESLYAENEKLAERVLQSVRVKSPILNPTAALAAVPRQVVDEASERTFANGHMSFKYPGSWTKKSEGLDPGAEGLQLVRFASPDATEILEVRFRKISPDQRFTNLGWQLTQAAARHVGRFHPSPDYPKETFTVGPVQTDWLRNDMAGSSMEIICSEISAVPNYAHVCYAYDRTRVRARVVSDLAARRLVMSSFAFSSAPTLVGEWVRQGEGLNLKADHTFERYEIHSMTSKPTVETGTYEINGNRLVFRNAGGGRARDESCTIFLRGESLTFCQPEFHRR